MPDNKNMAAMTITYDTNATPNVQMSGIMRQVAEFGDAMSEFYMSKHAESGGKDDMLAMYGTIFKHAYVNSIVVAAIYEAPVPEFYEKLLRFSHQLAKEMREYMDTLPKEKSS